MKTQTQDTATLSPRVVKSFGEEKNDNGQCAYFAIAAATNTPLQTVRDRLDEKKGVMPSFYLYRGKRNEGTFHETIQAYIRGSVRRGEVRKVSGVSGVGKGKTVSHENKVTLRKFAETIDTEKNYIVSVGTGRRSHSVALTCGDENGVWCNGKRYDIDDYEKRNNTVSEVISFVNTLVRP